jgi:phosphatidylglycerol lysyltransferase
MEITNYLLAKTLEWSKKKGYEGFNLGLAPLSEMGEKKPVPRWAKFSDQLYDHGEYLYNYKGFRHQKEKFNPQWQPMYLAAPGGLKLPTVLSNLSEMISGKSIISSIK